MRNRSGADYADLALQIFEIGGLAFLPGAGYLLGGAATIGERLSEQAELKKSLRNRVHIGASATSLAERAAEVATAVRTFAHAKLPIIIVIEDLQWMDTELPALLTQLASNVPKHPVIVLATMWPNTETPVTAEEQVRTWQREGLADVWQVPTLSTPDLRSIIDLYAPATDSMIKDFLANRWDNPYRLKLFLSWPIIIQRVHPTPCGLKLDLDIDELEKYPSKLRQMYDARWQSLDVEVQRALVAAAASIPRENPNHAFATELIAVAAATTPELLPWSGDNQSDTENAMALLAVYSRALTTSWLDKTEIAEIFNEPFLAEIALNALQDFMSVDSLDLFKNALINQIDDELQRELGSRSWIEITDAENDRAVFLCQWVNHLIESTWRGARFIPLASDLLVRVTNAQLQARSWKFEQALELLPERIITRSGIRSFIQDEDNYRVALAVAFWQGEFGEIEFARDLHLELVNLGGLEVPADTLPDSLRVDARIGLAHWTGICEQRSEALSLYETLLHDYPTHELVSSTQRMQILNGHALWVGENGDWVDASFFFHAGYQEMRSHLDPFHHLMLEARRGEARALGEAKNYAEAVNLYRAIYVDCLKHFGDLAPETLEAQRGLARWLLAHGETQEAAFEYSTVLRNSEKALGKDHIVTIWALQGQINAFLATRDLSKAEGALRDLKRRKARYDNGHRIHAAYGDQVEKWNLLFSNFGAWATHERPFSSE